MARRKRVYISGPMSVGDWEENIQTAEEAAKQLIEAGFSVLCPQLTGRMTDHEKIEHEVWIENDFPWVQCAEMVLRLPGESKGSDEECQHAKNYSIPIYNSVEELIKNVYPLCFFQG